MEIKLKDLPDCNKMKIYNKKNYNGLWVQIFVMPIAWLIIKLGIFVKKRNHKIKHYKTNLICQFLIKHLNIKN